MRVRKRIEYGQYIVADPEIYHGKLTFKGTRIMVRDVLYFVAKAYDWDQISAEYDGRINHEAIAEAIELAREALIRKTGREAKNFLDNLHTFRYFYCRLHPQTSSVEEAVTRNFEL